ncbi:MAG: TorF family putative porin [Burkholderiales bacterium]
MKLTVCRRLAWAAGALALSGGAFAQTAAAPTSNATPDAKPAMVEPDYTLSWHVAGVSDYRYRGISQTRLNPTLQGGVDFGTKAGVYLGVWASGIKWIRDAGGDARVEVDYYGGYKGSAGPISYDVGVLHYQYTRNHLNPSANTTELYAGAGWEMLNFKYSHSVTNLFGFAGSKNSGYYDLSATFDVGGGFSVVPHVGYQHVAHNRDFSNTDMSLGVSKDLYGFTLSAAVVAVSNKNYRSPDGRDLGRTGLVVGVKKVF